MGKERRRLIVIVNNLKKKKRTNFAISPPPTILYDSIYTKNYKLEIRREMFENVMSTFFHFLC